MPSNPMLCSAKGTKVGTNTTNHPIPFHIIPSVPLSFLPPSNQVKILKGSEKKRYEN